jgi:hypothetical protein
MTEDITASKILVYPVQRHRFPPNPTFTSSSVGRRLRLSSAFTAINMPGVQYPHCNAPCFKKRRRSSSNSPPGLNPSTVVISFPSQRAASTTQLVHARPVDHHRAGAAMTRLIAPLRHCQPKPSHSTSNNNAVSLASASTASPFTFSLSLAITFPPPDRVPCKWPGAQRP